MKKTLLSLIMLFVMFIGISQVNADYSIYLATQKGDLKAVQEQLDNGADVNTKYRYNETLLMVAAGYGHSDIVKLLLERGADATLTTVGGQTALSRAYTGGHTEIVNVLEAHLKSLPGESIEPVEQRLLKLKELVAQGKNLEFPFAIGTEKKQILADSQWGHPDYHQQGVYYIKEKITVYFENDKVSKIRKILSDVALNDVEKVFGPSTIVRDGNSDTITYSLGEYKVVFVHHYSFFFRNQIDEAIISKV